ncbi:MAG: hypothetical protein KIS66_07920 [Fimbriimonadaceae bacterium]|nr:hypothetical protein [Fimbriimonadaceae bacterium]
MLPWPAAFDADEPEGSSVGRSHLSGRDLRILLAVFAVLIAIAIPVYGMLRAQAWEHTCTGNLKAISQALLLYREENNDRFPPTHVDVGGVEAPLLVEKRAITWATQTQPYMSERASFKCPASSPDENVPTQHLLDRAKNFESSYGLFAPRGAAAFSSLENPDVGVVVSETANHGARDTYNPNPLLDHDGKPSPLDGFVIGFEGGNGRTIGPEATHVTRLAFPGTAGGRFEQNGGARHPSGIRVLFASGRVAWITPERAKIERRFKLPTRFWSQE